MEAPSVNIRIGRVAAATALALGVGSPFMGSAQAATTTQVVTAAELGQNWFPGDTRAPGTGTFESGPATPPLGTGSFELRTITNPEKVQLLTDDYDGTELGDISGLSYSTYRDPASTGFIAGVAALNLRVDLTGDGNPDAYLVYEPYQDQGNAAVLTGTWQTWDAYNGGAAKWWINTGAGGCGQATPCSWSTIVSTFPGATVEEGVNCGPGGVIAPCPGSLGVNQGSFNSGIISNVDNLRVSVGSDTTIYDFELFKDLDGDGIPDTAPPTDKDQCKHGGYASFNNPSFRNQGQCVSYVNGRR
jgi:hypothetical protein